MRALFSDPEDEALSRSRGPISYDATFPATLTPRISVPLPTTGLTNGTTYHVPLQPLPEGLGSYTNHPGVECGVPMS
jgi:hypothetical protein